MNSHQRKKTTTLEKTTYIYVCILLLIDREQEVIEKQKVISSWTPLAMLTISELKTKKKREDKENRQRKEKEKACLALKTQTLPVLLVVRKGNTTGLHPPKNNSNNNKCVHERLWKKGGKTPTSQMERRQNARAYKKKKRKERHCRAQRDLCIFFFFASVLHRYA